MGWRAKPEIRMTTTVTVPGASGTYIPNPYNTPYNLAVAQQISSVLAEASANDTLFVQDSDLNPGPVPTGDIGEIAVTVPGATSIVVPAGYTYTAIDQSVTGPITISGGGSLFAGNQNLTYYGTPAAGTVSIAVGDGNDLIALPHGTSYSAGLGNGNDTVYANGSGTVTGGSGDNLFFADSAGGTNEVNSYGANDTIVAGAGTVSVNTGGANPLVFGGSGSLQYIGGAPGNPTILGGSGTETLFGGSGQNITYFTGTDTVAGSDILAAGAGNETLNAGGASNGVELAAGIGTVDMIGTSGNDVFFGGSGVATMTGNGGADIFQFASANEPGGQHGGTNIITDFSSSDSFNTVGYGANAAQNALAAATVSGGNTTVKLSDNTTIIFLNVSNPNGIRSQSF
jgi:Ca2+-binding RTX toxin-like protein